MKDYINYSDFEKIDIRVGTVLTAEVNQSLKQPSMVLKIDFGKQIGIKKSSAQLLQNYNVEQLIGKQIAAVTNFKPKQIGKLISEVLVLGFPNNLDEPILISPDKKISNGVKLY